MATRTFDLLMPPICCTWPDTPGTTISSGKMENKKVLTELKDGVLIVTINRNERRNAIDPETSAMMEEVLNHAEKDPEVGCIIITRSRREELLHRGRFKRLR
ncbi:enoyl-CoA hydratase/isomerase family protein [Eubacterium sp. 14-2]|uniref:enoyl-CoA hydratase/isomerase family protein n=1 Tax=Eubacterium sp. 14-2 TaxID=1235790 RepID=UPI003528E230